MGRKEIHIQVIDKESKFICIILNRGMCLFQNGFCWSYVKYIGYINHKKNKRLDVIVVLTNSSFIIG